MVVRGTDHQQSAMFSYIIGEQRGVRSPFRCG